MRKSRQVQMVVLKTQEEAEAVKARIDAGEMTIYEAARDHSIDPIAKQTLGEMGWVTKGTGFAELNEFPVVVYEDTLDHLFKAEAEWIETLEEKAAQSPEDTQKRLEEAQKFMKP